LARDTQIVIEQYLVPVKRWWWLLVASVLVASVSSYVAVSRAPRIYQATTTVIVGQGLQKANPTYQDFSISQQLAQTYINMVQRQPILQGAAETLDLGYVPQRDMVSARIVPGTQLVEISVRDTAPDRARALADEIARQLILQTPTDSSEARERRDFVQGQLKRLQTNIQETADEIREEQARLDAANSARAIQQYQSNIAALQQKLSSYESSYASLLLTVQGGANYISVIEPAATPTRPISPEVTKTVLLSAAIGFGLALGGAILIEFMDDTIKTPDDVARTTDLPLLGTIARMAGSTAGPELITRQDTLAPVSESFRALRTNIQFSSLDETLCTLMVTSANAMEGKSLIMANLAIVLAQGGSSVLLVDADLRRPRQHELFGLENTHGLSNACLEAEPQLADYARPVALGELPEPEPGADAGQAEHDERQKEAGVLRVITSGPTPPNPADLLASGRMQALLNMLAEQADIVLIDAPPVLPVTDAVTLATRADGVLFVSSAGRTRRAAALQAIDRLHKVRANVLGVVLNGVSPRRGGQYTYYYAQADRKQRGSSTKRSVKKRGLALPWRARVLRRPRWWAGSKKSELAQPVQPGDHSSAEAETSDAERHKKTRSIKLDNYFEPVPVPKDVDKSKRTQQIRLSDYLESLTGIQSGGEDKVDPAATEES
jgi:Mrp family chromosome partitioning ATPase/capsular polysaccharide biosynthesis protein